MCEMYSQRDEELYILNYFKGYTGRFLDIGAYDGKTFSNTHRLARNQWSGVCVEPSPTAVEALKRLYAKNQRIKVYNVGIGSKRGVMAFYHTKDAVSTFDADHAELWKQQGVPYTKIEMKVITLEDLLEQEGYDFDFINTDTEGWDLDILKTVPFNKLPRLKMFCVEFGKHLGEMLEIFERNGFQKYYQTAENLLVVKDK